MSGKVTSEDASSSARIRSGRLMCSPGCRPAPFRTMRSRNSFGIGSGSSATPSSSRSECLASVPSWSIRTCGDWPEIAPCTTTLPRCRDALTVQRLVRHSSSPPTLTMSGTARTTVPTVGALISSPVSAGTVASARVDGGADRAVDDRADRLADRAADRGADGVADGTDGPAEQAPTARRLGRDRCCAMAVDLRRPGGSDDDGIGGSSIDGGVDSRIDSRIDAAVRVGTTHVRLRKRSGARNRR